MGGQRIKYKMKFGHCLERSSVTGQPVRVSCDYFRLFNSVVGVLDVFQDDMIATRFTSQSPSPQSSLSSQMPRNNKGLLKSLTLLWRGLH